MEATTIHTLFDARTRKFEIPAYQRSYSWEDKQVKQFIEDLKDANAQYYLGHFLFEESSDNTILIIDGQQRLTTCVIFFSSLVKEINYRIQKGEKLTIDPDDISDYYIRDCRKGIQKFKTVAYDNNFFTNEIIDRKECSQSPNSLSQNRIGRAKEIFDKEFSKTETKELERWYYLVINATITQFVVASKVQAAQIFAFQNDRGKSLSKLDKIKSYFMLQIYLNCENNEVINEYIRYLENEFSIIYQRIVTVDENEDDVLTYYWRAISGKGYYSEEIVEGVKKALDKVESKINWIKEFVSGISKAFDTIIKIKHSDNTHIINLRYLKNIAISSPFFINADRTNASEKTFHRLAHFLENITFRSLLRGGRADIESRLNWYLINSKSDMEINDGIDSMINKLKNDWWWGYWNDSEMLNHLQNGWFYGNRVDNYLLWRYEEYLCNENYPIPKLHFNDVISNESIEHIAPQTMPNPMECGYGIYDDFNNPQNGINSGHWMNSVGNLMLMAGRQNSSLGNKSFTHKLSVFGKDNLLNQQKEIIEFVDDKSNPIWNKNSIEKRFNKILDAAKCIWNLDSI